MADGKTIPTSGAFKSGTHFGGNLNIFDTNEYYAGAQSTRGVGLIDPHLSGYSLLIVTSIPKWVADGFGGDRYCKALLQRNFQALDGINDLTLETGTTTSGFNQNETQWITAGGKKAVGFTTKMKEYSGSPVSEFFRYWSTGVRDPETGIALYPKWANIDYATRNHCAEFLYIQMRPDVTNVNAAGRNIEKAYLSSGNMFTIGLPREIREPCGTSYTLSQ